MLARGFTLDPATVIRQYVQHSITASAFGKVRYDWLKPVLPLYGRVLADASPLPWTEAHSICVATAEGVILTKMVAFRPQNQVDIETLLTANRDTIDLPLIRSEWSPYAPTEPDRPQWLEAVIARRIDRRE